MTNRYYDIKELEIHLKAINEVQSQIEEAASFVDGAYGQISDLSYSVAQIESEISESEEAIREATGQLEELVYRLESAINKERNDAANAS